MTGAGIPPRVTIGVPVYNGERFLDAALGAVCAQTFDDMEILVADNASTDGTRDIVERFAADDPRIRLLPSATNRGGTWNFNRLLHEARAPLFKWAPADDLVAPTLVSRCVALLDEDRRLAAAIPRAVFIDETDAVIEERHDERLGLDDPAPHERVFTALRGLMAHLMYGVVRTDTLRRLGGTHSGAGGDWGLTVGLCIAGPIGHVPEQLLMQRRHEQQSNGRGAGIVTWDRPSAAGARIRLGFANTAINRALFDAVRTSDLPAGEKARCASAVLRAWTLPHLPGSLASDLFDVAGLRWPPAVVERLRGRS